MNNRYLYLKYNFDMIISKKAAHELIVFFFDSTRNQKMIITDEKNAYYKGGILYEKGEDAI